MLNIIEHGKPIAQQKKNKRFRCLKCGCVFDTDENIVICSHINGVVERRGVQIKTNFAAPCLECDGAAEEVAVR